jgi:type I restriction enzyme S subunit
MPEGGSKEGWQRRRFDEIAAIVNDRIDNPSEAGVERYVGLEHLDSDSLTIRRWGSPSDVAATKLLFRKGDIIFGRRRVYQRKLAVAEFDGICSAHAMVLRAKPDFVLDEFLPFFMQSDLFMQRAKEISVGSLSPTINWMTLASEEFLLPPLEEQRSIVGMLSAMNPVGEATLNIHLSIQRLRAAHLDAFFRPRCATGERLTNVARITSGNTPPRSDAALWNGDRPWASGKDLKVRSLINTEDRLTDAGWKAATIAPRGATLIVVRGMILAHTFPVARCEREIAFNQDLRAIIAEDRVEPEYLLLWTEWAAPWFLSRTASSSHGTKRIESNVFAKALVPVPARSEQRRFVKEHQGLLDSSTAAVLRLSAYGRLKRSLVGAVLEMPE